MTNLYRLFRLQCQDLLVLQEMEYNGMLFAKEEALQRADELELETNQLIREFRELLSCEVVDITSGDHVSAVLYGGVVDEKLRIPNGVYKSGDKVGQIRYKIEHLEHKFDRLIYPLKGTETKKNIQGLKETWEVNVDILKKLRCNGKVKHLISLILKYRKLHKLKNTYLRGWSKLIDENDWQDNYVHGNLNQITAITGRLASSKPNLQNADKETKKYLISRYVNSGE